MQELVMYMHAFVFLFGISICLKDDKHVRIDVISNKLDEKIKRVIEVRVGSSHNSFLYLCYL